MSPSRTNPVDLVTVGHDELNDLLERFGQQHVASFAHDRADDGWVFRQQSIDTLRRAMDAPKQPAQRPATADGDYLGADLLSNTRRVRFDATRGGLGDICVAAWCMRGYERMGVDAAFGPVRNAKGTLAQCLGVRIDPSPRPSELQIPLGNNFPPYAYELRIDGGRRPRLAVWAEQLPFRPTPMKPHLSVPPCGAAWARDDLREHRCPNGEPLVVLFPSTSGYPAREWPDAHWFDLATMLAEAGCGVAIMVEANNKQDAKFYRQMVYWGFSIKKVIGAIDEADLVIAADTGPAHIAGCADTPCLALTGPTRDVFAHYDSVQEVAVSDEVIPCVGCHFQGSRGFRPACERGCQALMRLTPAEVAARACFELNLEVGV